LSKRCVFFDRDGIVNRSPGPGYVERWEDFHILPGFISALQTVLRHGYVAVIASNQRGVARGMITRETVDDMHRRFREVLRTQHGIDVLEVFYCPHDHGQCDCRKPQPGMLLRAAKQYDIDLAASWMVGDNEKDAEAGIAAGCRAILVSENDKPTKAEIRIRSMDELAALLDRVLANT
jgi:D-glycero-D-manno-heptose 1,7-bisphosphate phosphatase